MASSISQRTEEDKSGNSSEHQQEKGQQLRTMYHLPKRGNMTMTLMLLADGHDFWGICHYDSDFSVFRSKLC